MNWTCPVCQHAQAITGAKFWTTWDGIQISDHALGEAGIRCTAIACANHECRELTLTIRLTSASTDSVGRVVRPQPEATIMERRIRPEGSSRPQPGYIPTGLTEDYFEACAVRDLSPKASATLSRRCLQGMIRDFAGISRKTLNQEIVDLRKAVEDGSAPRDVSIESVTAIDHVRTIGNIGAHMEADVNHVIAVEPGEAQILIEVVESLFDEWYVERHRRQSRFAQVAALADAKKLAKATAPALPAPE